MAGAYGKCMTVICEVQFFTIHTQIRCVKIPAFFTCQHSEWALSWTTIVSQRIFLQPTIITPFDWDSYKSRYGLDLLLYLKIPFFPLHKKYRRQSTKKFPDQKSIKCKWISAFPSCSYSSCVVNASSEVSPIQLAATPNHQPTRVCGTPQWTPST